ncbi:hypothetical protein BLNAU_13375 [Blattamonas nauphoetae]|uniref:Uncharacterized protein n=1 Tax=Blattamonas nauphoetae TaxID=2049346 RepID=A0ABQ9XGP3_9EUKA|nr:hypothetical protein BLNAU_13375 [Blattamonas nauphoetae]
MLPKSLECDPSEDGKSQFNLLLHLSHVILCLLLIQHYLEEVIRGYCSSLRNCSEKETLPIITQIRTFLESDLDALPTRCAIAESCGLLSILSDIVSSHSSIGLKSIASGLLALIQNALGSCESQTKEHQQLNSQNKSTMTTQVNDMNERLLKLQTTVCSMATQMTEHFRRMDSRQMKFDSILSRLEMTWRSDFLQQVRFQRWSKQGADAIEIFDEDFIIKTGNTFTLRQRPENEVTNFIPKTLFSPIISSDVAQLSFTVTHSNDGFRFGATSAHLIDTGTQEFFWKEKSGNAGWGGYYEPPAVFQANGAPPQRHTVKFLLEADCRVGQRTLKLSDNEAVHSDFYKNLPRLFRFVITLHHPSVSVTIHSLSFTAKPTLKGGTE